MAAKGNCANSYCDNKVDFGDIEVVGEGFVCSIICEAVVNGTVEIISREDVR